MQRRSDGSGQPDAVRFALACRGDTLEAWQARCVEKLRDTPGVRLEAVVAVPAGSDGRSHPLLYRLWRDRARRAPELRPVRLDRVASGVDRIEGRLATTGGTRELVAAGAGGPIRLDPDLDFLLTFGLPAVGGKAAELPRRGVWAFDFDLDGQGGAALHGLTSVLDGDATLEVHLVRLDPTGRESAVLSRGRFATDPRSPARTVVRPLEEVAAWPARACREDTGSLPGRKPGNPPVEAPPGRNRTEAPPSNLQMAGLGLRVLTSRLSFARDRLFRHPQWNIGVVDQPIEAFVRDGSSPPVDWYPLEGRTSFLADPFGIDDGDETTVLCERFDYRSGKGSICTLRAEEGRLRPEPERALETSVHASYPCLVREEREIYCVPEIRAAGETALFRAIRFPDQWERIGPLLPDVAAVDPTVFRHGGHWWLACTEDGRFPDARLLMFHAERLEGPWTSHAGNPVKIDVTSARPGGTPFEHAGELYRPAQDCSRTYGGAIVLNRVDRLTPTRFSEEPVASVEPEPGSPYPAGRHTLSALGDRTLIDGHRFVFAWDAFEGFMRIWARDLLGRRDGEAGPSATPSDGGDRPGRTTPEGG